MKNRVDKKKTNIMNIVAQWMSLKKLDEDLMTKMTEEINTNIARVQSNLGKPLVDEKFSMLQSSFHRL